MAINSRIQSRLVRAPEWVPKGQENGRRVIDHSKSVELVHTGRIDMKRYHELKEVK